MRRLAVLLATLTALASFLLLATPPFAAADELSGPFLIVTPEADGLTLDAGTGQQVLAFAPAKPPSDLPYTADAFTEVLSMDPGLREQQFTALQWSYQSDSLDRGAWNLFISYSLDGGDHWFNAGSGQTPSGQAGVQLQAIDLVAHGRGITLRLRFTLNQPAPAASPPLLVTLSSPLLISDIRVWHRDYVPPEKPSPKPTRKPKPTHSAAENPPSGESGLGNDGGGSGAGSGSGSGSGGGNGSGDGSANNQGGGAVGASTTSPVKAPAAAGEPGTWVSGFPIASLSPVDAGQASGAGGAGQEVAASSAGSRDDLYLVFALIVVAALAAPGPIMARRLHRFASFDHSSRPEGGAVVLLKHSSIPRRG